MGLHEYEAPIHDLLIRLSNIDEDALQKQNVLTKRCLFPEIYYKNKLNFVQN